jgi:hypothetical protein
VRQGRRSISVPAPPEALQHLSHHLVQRPENGVGRVEPPGVRLKLAVDPVEVLIDRVEPIRVLRAHRPQLLADLLDVVVEAEGEPAGLRVVDRQLAYGAPQLVIPGHAAIVPDGGCPRERSCRGCGQLCGDVDNSRIAAGRGRPVVDQDRLGHESVTSGQ